MGKTKGGRKRILFAHKLKGGSQTFTGRIFAKKSPDFLLYMLVYQIASPVTLEVLPKLFSSQPNFLELFSSRPTPLERW